MITINSQLDMTPGAIPVVIHRSQYDSDFSIVFTLFSRTGDFIIASGTTAKVRGTKKSGTGYSADATIDVSAKTVTVAGNQQMTVVSGQNIFEIVLMSGTKELCSANFILNVERAALDMDTITDDTVIRELDNLDQFITEAEAAADRAENAAATFSVDATLTVSGKAADAKKTGDELAKKVDAVSGKGLSTNDYTDEEKTKLAGVETGANKTVIDTTLTQTGQAADAKAVGDAIASEDKKALAAFATDTASGAVANFPDGADSIPMKDVLVHFDPVQDLHGYDSPWPAGGGKNLLNPKNYNVFPKIMNGITFTQDDDGGIRANGTATAQARFYFYYNSSESFSEDVIISCIGATDDYRLYADNIGGVGDNDNKILSANTTIGNLFLYVESGATVNTVVYPMIRLATESDSTFAPYSNICPITGWTKARVTRTGKNLLPSYAIGRQKTENGITATANADGSITYVGTSTGTFFGLGDSASISVKAGTYTLSARNNTDISINIVNAVTGSFIDRVTGNDSKVITFANDKKIYYLTTILSGKTIDTTATYQLELGSTATDYEPYHADTYDITFPAEAGTVYGGTLDVTKGELVVDRAMVDPGTLDWENYNVSGTRVFRTQSLANAALQYDGLNIICSNYPTVAASQKKDKSISIGSNSSVWIIDSNYSNVSEFKAAILGSQLVYELATPITYTLTPQEITSLLGTNNLWADTGDSEVEYRADTKVYVDAKVAAAESNITSLQNSKVDKTTPLLNFDDTATDPLTDDGSLANALRTLGILSSVIPSGGDALYLKKTLTQLAQLVTPVRTEFTPSSGTADTSAGKCYYEVIGKLVHVHVALTGLTVNTQSALYTLPAGVRPRHRMTTIGVCGHITYRSYVTLQTSGALAVYSQEDNTMADMFYTL